MLIAARDNGYGAKDQDRIVLDTVSEYRIAMRDFAGMPNLDVWYARMEIEPLSSSSRAQFKARMVKRTEETLAKARTRDSMSAFAKLTAAGQRNGGDRRPVAADRAAAGADPRARQEE